MQTGSPMSQDYRRRGDGDLVTDTDTPVHAHAPPGYLRTADLFAALSLASDLAVGLPAEHAVRSCYIAMHVAEQMQLPAEQQIDLYYAMLLMDAGCTAWTSQLAGVGGRIC
jgi:hypothetical protein